MFHMMAEEAFAALTVTVINSQTASGLEGEKAGMSLILTGSPVSSVASESGAGEKH